MIVDEYFWPYLAGFFDGEGNIALMVPSPTIMVAQSGSIGKIVINELCEAIKSQCAIRGIKGSIKVLEWKVNPKNTQNLVKQPKNALTSYRLVISHRDAIGFVLRAMLPFLRVKKVQAQDLLRFHRLFPKMSSSWTRKRSDSCKKGHRFTEQTTGLCKKTDRYGRKNRYCKICHRGYRAARKAARA